MESSNKIVGTLLPISALVSSQNVGQGTFATALPFLDWLHRTHQTAWQILPLHETQLESGSLTKHVPSPYNTYGIGLDPQYLSKSFRPTQLSRDVGESISSDSREIPANWGEKDLLTSLEMTKIKFIHNNEEWLEDYALFCALRDEFGTDDWRKWDSGLRSREEDAIARWTEKLQEKINSYITLQWQTTQSYQVLRKKATELGIFLIGDLPFYLSIKSPLVWAHQEVFQIGSDGSLNFVSGIPNTQSAHFGRQVWGHPLYNWESKESWQKIIAFWEMRLHYQSTLYDLIRIDHAKAFFEHGVIDPNSDQNDSYKKGPGLQVFEELVHFCTRNRLSIFAEDTGENLSELRDSLRRFSTPGIKLFRFAYNEKKEKMHKEYADIAAYPQNTIAYTTTHDTETLLGYLKLLSVNQKKELAAESGVAYHPDDKEFARQIREAIIASPARIVIIPMQDWLLTTDRINVPGTELPVDDPNWRFKLEIPVENLPEINVSE